MIIESYKDESAVDVAIRAYGNIEGLITLCLQNNMLLDGEELTANVRQVDKARQKELKRLKAVFPQAVIRTEEVVVIYSGQNIIDLALQETGSVEGLVNLLNRNEFLFDTTPDPGGELKVSKLDVMNDEIRNYYKGLKYIINTGDVDLDGIGYMIIEDTFIVD